MTPFVNLHVRSEPLSRSLLSLDTVLTLLMCVFPPQVVCVWLPPAAAEGLEGTV